MENEREDPGIHVVAPLKRKEGVDINIAAISLVLLGLVMLVPGLIKLFVMKPSAITGMLSGLGFPVAALFAWILIGSEIVFGSMILMRYKLHYTVLPPVCDFGGRCFLGTLG